MNQVGIVSAPKPLEPSAIKNDLEKLSECLETFGEQDAEVAA